MSKVIGAEELLGRIAFAEFVHVIKMLGPSVPIRGKWKLLTAITACVGYARMGLRGVKGGMRARKCSARPRVPPEMERVLMSFGLVLVLETVRTELAGILFL